MLQKTTRSNARDLSVSSCCWGKVRKQDIFRSLFVIENLFSDIIPCSKHQHGLAKHHVQHIRRCEFAGSSWRLSVPCLADRQNRCSSKG